MAGADSPRPWKISEPARYRAEPTNVCDRQHGRTEHRHAHRQQPSAALRSSIGGRRPHLGQLRTEFVSVPAHQRCGLDLALGELQLKPDTKLFSRLDNREAAREGLSSRRINEQKLLIHT